MNVAFWRRWHRWIGFPAALFLLFAAVTGMLVAGTEFFGAAEAEREATRDLVSAVRAGAPTSVVTEPIARALEAVALASPGSPVDRVTVQLKGTHPTVTVFTGKAGGGEDRQFVIDATSGHMLRVEPYADKPFLYRLHSGEAFGDGGLVLAMLWGLSLALLTLSGLVIYWRMRRRNPVGIQRVFW